MKHLPLAKGKSLAYLVHPLESWAEKYVGGSMRTTLKQRHTMLDHDLEKLIQENPDLQVLEIACGLSPRGWWFRQHYPSISYRELDLPDMAQTKQNALQQIEKMHLRFYRSIYLPKPLLKHLKCLTLIAH